MPTSHEPSVEIFTLVYQPESWAPLDDGAPLSIHDVRVRGQLHTKTKRFSVHAVDVSPRLPQQKGPGPYTLMMAALEKAIKAHYEVERVTGLTSGKIGLDDKLRSETST